MGPHQFTKLKQSTSLVHVNTIGPTTPILGQTLLRVTPLVFTSQHQRKVDDPSTRTFRYTAETKAIFPRLSHIQGL